MKLFEITKELDRFLADMPEDKEEARAKFNEIIEARKDKLEQCTHAYLNYLAEAEAVKAQEQKFAARRKTAENKAEWLKGYIAGALKPGEKVKTDTFTLGWRKSEVVSYDDDFVPDTLPQELKKVTVKANTAEIKKLLKAGEEIPGIELKTNNNLQIK